MGSQNTPHNLLTAWEQSAKTRAMSTNPLKAVELRIAELRKELEVLENFVQAYSGVTALPLEQEEPDARTHGAMFASEGAVIAFTPTREIIRMAEELLAETGHPLPAAKIYDTLYMRGMRLKGKNPKGNLTARFSVRRDIFHYDKDTGMWSLQKWRQNAEKTEGPDDAEPSTIERPSYS